TAASRLCRIEHPRTIPCRIPWRCRPVDPNVDVRERAEASGVEQLTGTDREGLVSLGQGNRYVPVESRRLLGHGCDLGGVDPHGLLHHERNAAIEEIVRDAGHLPMPAERDDE